MQNLFILLIPHRYQGAVEREHNPPVSHRCQTWPECSSRHVWCDHSYLTEIEKTKVNPHCWKLFA